MKLMTKGRRELHKRLLNTACNKPKITRGRRGGGGRAVPHEALDRCCALHYNDVGNRGLAEAPIPISWGLAITR